MQEEAQMQVLQRHSHRFVVIDAYGQPLAVFTNHKSAKTYIIWFPGKPDTYKDEAFKKHGSYQPKGGRSCPFQKQLRLLPPTLSRSYRSDPTGASLRHCGSV
jgi:hypothetical protein